MMLMSLCMAAAWGDDIEPRRWTPLPVGTRIVGVGYAYTNGDLFFDPVLQLEDTSSDVHTVAASYVQSFSVLGKATRLDIVVPWQSAEWNGILRGAPARTDRVGFADPVVRLSVHLLGNPALGADDFRRQMSTRRANTVLGVAVSVALPWGEYFDDKLLNLGQNRYVFRPQVGVLHTRGAWSYELTGSAFLFGDNDDFFGGTRRKQEPLYAVQAHVVRLLEPRFWVSVSAGYGIGGRSTIGSVEKDDERADVLAGISAGMALPRRQSLKIAYVRSWALRDVGADTGTLSVAWTVSL